MHLENSKDHMGTIGTAKGKMGRWPENDCGQIRVVSGDIDGLCAS
jgi:hypothetical protein